MTVLTPPSLDDITRARRNIKSKACISPLVRLSAAHTPPGLEIWLKCENLQPIGSFKCRPAANAIAEADQARVAAAGVFTASAGNFGQGLASCCEELGIQCTVIAPTHAPQTKLDSMRRFGATVVQVPYAQWWEILKTRVCPLAPVGAAFIHPGAEDAVLAGNATIAAEILEVIPDVDTIVAPWGSGALAVGIACGVYTIQRVQREEEGAIGCKVVAVEPETAAPFALSMQKGKPCKFDAWTPSFVDGCGGKAVLPEIWDLAQKHLPSGLLSGVAVPLDDIPKSISALLTGNRILAEGAGACSVAAAVTGLCGPQARKIVCVVSGGGIDTDILCEILSGKVSARDLYKGASSVPTQVSGSRTAISVTSATETASVVDFDAKVAQLGLKLPVPPEPKGLYKPAVVSGTHVYLSGHGPANPDGQTYIQGRVGKDMTLAEGKLAGRATGLAALSSLRRVLGGSLNRVKRVVKILGMVNLIPEMKTLECVTVVNGFSEVMVEVFGEERGVGARSAVGVQNLPMNIPVEVEIVFEIFDEK